MSGSATQAPPLRTADDRATLPLEELESRLDVRADGLDAAEAARRQERYGPNELPHDRRHPLLDFLSYFWGPIPWMIEAAVVLSAVVGHWEDFGIIIALLLMNALVGFWEEHQAGNTIASLERRLAPRARVKRDGHWTTLPSRELVPGDIVRLRLGDIVPADLRLLEGDPVEVDQSALTGESLPVEHAAGDALYSGSIVRQGEADALVYGTGADTFMGRTAHLVEQAHTRSHFQQAVLRIGRYLILLAAGLVSLILAVSLLRGEDFLTTVRFALVLTVAAVPVAMPTVLSVTMAVGARLLAAKEAIVSRLASIEELAGMNVLCSDKTGTLTKNELTPGEPFAVDGVSADTVLREAALASRAEDHDPIDDAVLAAAPSPSGDGAVVTAFHPFDPVRKRTEAEVRDHDGTVYRATKGAPQVVLDLVADGDDVRRRVEAEIEDLASRGYRALGVARTDADGKWRFLGVLPLLDPPRDDTKAMLDQTRALGIGVKMVTGDQKAIAREIAGRVGLGTHILDAKELGDGADATSPEMVRRIEEADGFAQVFPEHKYEIVEALQSEGRIVGMTGDGVNDAPALKKADVGIAVSGATDAARSAAAIVLLAPGLSVITDAVRESRRIFQRMTSYGIYRIAETIRVLLFMTLSILVFDFYPVTAVMIVLLALLNDGAILSIAYDRTRPSSRPDAWKMSTVLTIATVLGIAGVIASFGLFYAADRIFHLDRAVLQSLMYLKLSVAGHLTIFVARTRGSFYSFRPSRVLLGAVLGTQGIATIIAATGILMTPIGWGWAFAVWGYALFWFVVNDFVKRGTYRFLERRRAAEAAAT